MNAERSSEVTTMGHRSSAGASVVRVCTAGFLAWLIPGLGHIYLGERKRGFIFLVTIAATFWSGVAIGGVRGTVQPHQHTAWFMAQVNSGGHALAAYGLHKSMGMAQGKPWPYVGHWLSIDIGIVYTAVAGLLNVLIIMDALVRADSRNGKT